MPPRTPTAAYVVAEDGRYYLRQGLRDRGKQAAKTTNDGRDVTTVSITTPDGETLEAETTEELQEASARIEGPREQHTRLCPRPRGRTRAAHFHHR